MALNFPNPSRQFDERRKAIRFSGYDGVFEVRFMVEASALAEAGTPPADMTEPKCLEAFDRRVAKVHEAARTAYARQRREDYTLSASDLR
jgi:hypothetical protein